MSESKPVPLPDRDTAPYWEAARSSRLSLPKCPSCGKLYFPPKPRCPVCLHETLEWVDVSGAGVVHSFCIMHMSLVPGFEPPYVIGVIELDEQPGLMITTDLVDCPPDAVRIGMAVEVLFEQRTETVAVPQFRRVACQRASLTKVGVT